MFLSRQEWYNKKYIKQKEKYGRIYAKLLIVDMLRKRDERGGMGLFVCFTMYTFSYET